MALASGLPVPEIYVLEQESGINAFAAGRTSADAAIAVTRGALERLDAHELQGVIAHEFSHILNGDMRLNQQLIGLSFGILVLSLVGRWLLAQRPLRAREPRGRNSGGIAAAVAIGLALIDHRRHRRAALAGSSKPACRGSASAWPTPRPCSSRASPKASRAP